VLARELGRGHRPQAVATESVSEVTEPELFEAARRVDQDVAVWSESAEYVHLVQQRRVLHDESVGLGDRLAHTDLLVVDPAERDHGRPGALGAEARERLRMAPFDEGGDGHQLGCRDNALAAAPMDAQLEHQAHSPTQRPSRYP
jgi:hypothetical protein